MSSVNSLFNHKRMCQWRIWRVKISRIHPQDAEPGPLGLHQNLKSKMTGYSFCWTASSISNQIYCLMSNEEIESGCYIQFIMSFPWPFLHWLSDVVAWCVSIVTWAMIWYCIALHYTLQLYLYMHSVFTWHNASLYCTIPTTTYHALLVI